ncbi:uncharacterized protein CLUP02_03093 [Colletotrichum lupini]|uniref:Uncharacterized protein n=1 Tax=Colletotrichum lupini TaxID=145971 RepID=A0A9Q8SHX9_9PEZI|nr:uncharacterized protein CLUP02_03093 [Colletotrichum lupini]UQC77624.1 hypothetical protein CLUP02_03093 [Colletotrichum lupini]
MVSLASKCNHGLLIGLHYLSCFSDGRTGRTLFSSFMNAVLRAFRIQERDEIVSEELSGPDLGTRTVSPNGVQDLFSERQ